MANNQNSTRRSGNKKGGGGKTVAAVAVAALLLGGGGYYGLTGDGMGFLPNHEGIVMPSSADPADPAVITTAEPAEDITTKHEEETEGIAVRVYEDKIYYNGEELTLQAFEETLLKDYREGIEISLQDDHAVKASYDAVKAVLDKLNYKYTEK